MIYDRQIQDLERNYKMIRAIRDNEQLFTNLINHLKINHDALQQREMRLLKMHGEIDES